MLIIRLRRAGKRNKPTYRVVVAEHSWPVNGKFTADLGSYNPHTKSLILNDKVAMEWLNKGAQPSNSVAKLLVTLKLKHNSITVTKRNKAKKVKTAASAAPTAAATAPADTTTEEVADTSVAEAAESSEEAPTEQIESSEPTS